MKKLLSVLLASFVLLTATPVFAAERCAITTNLTLRPDRQVNVVAAGWLNWLNRPYTFTCSGDSATQTCTHGTEVYRFTYACNTAECWVTVWEGSSGLNIRNMAHFPNGNIGNWYWDRPNEHVGYLLPNCVVSGIFSGPCSPLYRSCFRD